MTCSICGSKTKETKLSEQQISSLVSEDSSWWVKLFPLRYHQHCKICGAVNLTPFTKSDDKPSIMKLMLLIILMITIIVGIYVLMTWLGNSYQDRYICDQECKQTYCPEESCILKDWWKLESNRALCASYCINITHQNMEVQT